MFVVWFIVTSPTDQTYIDTIRRHANQSFTYIMAQKTKPLPNYQLSNIRIFALNLPMGLDFLVNINRQTTLFRVLIAIF